MLVSFVLSFFPRDVLDEILNLIGSVSEGFPSYSYTVGQMLKNNIEGINIVTLLPLLLLFFFSKVKFLNILTIVIRIIQKSVNSHTM